MERCSRRLAGPPAAVTHKEVSFMHIVNIFIWLDKWFLRCPASPVKKGKNTQSGI